VQNLSNEIELDLHENEPVGETHCTINGFATRLRGKRQLVNGLFGAMNQTPGIMTRL